MLTPRETSCLKRIQPGTIFRFNHPGKNAQTVFTYMGKREDGFYTCRAYSFDVDQAPIHDPSFLKIQLIGDTNCRVIIYEEDNVPQTPTTTN